VEPCARDQRGSVECLWTPEIDISPARFDPGSQGSQHQVVCTMRDGSSIVEVPRLVVIRPGGA